jgi:hypothetical protein
VLRDVVHVAHRGLDVGVPHPVLHVGDRRDPDREGPEGVAQVVENDRSALARRCPSSAVSSAA